MWTLEFVEIRERKKIKEKEIGRKDSLSILFLEKKKEQMGSSQKDT